MKVTQKKMEKVVRVLLITLCSVTVCAIAFILIALQIRNGEKIKKQEPTVSEPTGSIAETVDSDAPSLSSSSPADGSSSEGEKTTKKETDSTAPEDSDKSGDEKTTTKENAVVDIETKPAVTDPVNNDQNNRNTNNNDNNSNNNTNNNTNNNNGGNSNNNSNGGNSGGANSGNGGSSNNGTNKTDNKPADNGSTAKKSKQLSVTNVLQKPELPTGCETTALTILLNHYGYNIDKVTLARNYLPKQEFYWQNGKMYGADFRTTFAGDPEKDDSYGCYAPCIVTTANAYLSSVGAGKSAYNTSGTSLDNLLTSYIDNNTPVLIWITYGGLQPSYLSTIWTTPSGETVQWRAWEHCVVLTGYDLDKGLIYVSDPLVGNTSYNYDTLKQRFIEMGQQSVRIG